ncbi:MAG: ArsR family transcriptional regulator [Zestosphaera sp.]
MDVVSTDNGSNVNRKLGLKVVYEDSDIVVFKAPNEEQLLEILKNLLRERPMSVKELHTYLSGLASEDKIRKALIKLVNDGKAYVMNDGRFVIAGLE